MNFIFAVAGCFCISTHIFELHSWMQLSYLETVGFFHVFLLSFVRWDHSRVWSKTNWPLLPRQCPSESFAWENRGCCEYFSICPFQVLFHVVSCCLLPNTRGAPSTELWISFYVQLSPLWFSALQTVAFLASLDTQRHLLNSRLPPWIWLPWLSPKEWNLSPSTSWGRCRAHLIGLPPLCDCRSLLSDV